jgi:hypothetical protein
MNKLNKTFSFISVCCAILVFSFAVYYIWTTAKGAMLSSCVSSLAGDVVEYSHEIGNFAQNGETWYVLTDDEVKYVFSNKRITFGSCSTFKSQPQDLKERNLKIAVKKNSEYGYKIIVWSKGFDNISGTEDDISSSWDEKIPN